MFSSSSSDDDRRKKRDKKKRKKEKRDKKDKKGKKEKKQSETGLNEASLALLSAANASSSKRAAGSPERDRSSAVAPQAPEPQPPEEEIENTSYDPSAAVDCDLHTELKNLVRLHDNEEDDGFADADAKRAEDSDDDDEPFDPSALSTLLSHAHHTSAAFIATRNEQEAEHQRRLASLSTELLKTSTVSTALVVVGTNAADEQDQMTNDAVKKKAPPPPPEDAKKIIKLQYVDHSAVAYRPFEKDFYIPPPDIKAMTEDDVKQLLDDLDGALVRGREIPRPMKNWDGTGLPDAIISKLTELTFSTPFAVQCIGIPVLMSGRDLLVSAKTGSGKTLMYSLPMIRHAMAQRRCGRGEGPIGLILLPTQELASQVHDVIQPFAAAAGLRVACSHGCVQLSDNIKACKAGCDIMIAVPGRLLDLLTISGGKMLSLERVTMVVVDEVDRMFDSGFMEHTTAFLKNVRPDRQVAFVSATLPRSLKRSVMEQLQHPIELTVGGRPTPASNVHQTFCFFDEQLFEVDADTRKPDERLPKLLQSITEMRNNTSSKGTMMVFVQTKDECNQLFADLTRCGYRGKVALLYSGMDKLDREYALERFSPEDQFILISTGLGERGLDIAHLDLVVNYTMPDHYEAYVHRIGRTGRAGRTGNAVSFFTRIRDDDVAAELVEGLERAKQDVPEELHERAAVMRKKRQDGLAPARSAGFYKGYGAARKMELTRDQKGQLRAAAKEAGLEGFVSSSESELESSGDDEDNGRTRRGDPDIVEDGDGASRQHSASSVPMSNALVVQKAATGGALAMFDGKMADRLAEARRFAESATDVFEKGEESKKRFRSEFPINDEPIFVRQKLQNAQNIKAIEAKTNTTIVRKGYYFDPKLKSSYKMKDGERPLYLLIHGFTIESVRAVFRELDALKKEAKAKEARKWSAMGAQL
jgi:ATP-dependent RNA helicase DDX46/PRP5